ncbi:MAG: ATP synthase F1 subunit delta [Bacilli bacterium]|nr:ATP synthase F1 subunit delta [Bacilli bacterium]
MKTEVSMQYAKALFELANGEEKQEFYETLKIVNQVINNDVEVLKVFEHPRITPDQKKEIIEKVFKDKVSKTIINFLYVIIDHQRIKDLGDILETYKSLLDEHNNFKEVNVYAKYPLTDKQKQELKIALIKKYNKKIILREYLDEKLVGGIKVVVDNEVIDATSLNKLQKIKDILKG